MLDIVPEQAADFDAGFLAITTPLARHRRALRRCGGAIPAGRRGQGASAFGQAERTPGRARCSCRRDAATRDAVQHAKTDETIQLALTFSSKWGDYDPEPLERDTWSADNEKDTGDARSMIGRKRP